MRAKKPELEVVDVWKCCRCDGDHVGLVFRPLSNPPVDADGQVLFEHFAICPSLGEPILMHTHRAGDRNDVSPLATEERR